jgi:hypothetical protein
MARATYSLKFGPPTSGVVAEELTAAPPRPLVDTVVAKKGETVEWTCRAPAAILFDPVTPFASRSYSNRQGGRLVDHAGKSPGQLLAPGRFKYIVAVYDRKKKRVWIDDPDIVVDY